MVFGRGMALPAGFEIGRDEAAKQKQKRINESCERESKRRIEHTYQQGGKVLLKVPKKILRKLERVRRGPLRVIRHYGNGSAKIQKGPCHAGTASIRRLGPFIE